MNIRKLGVLAAAACAIAAGPVLAKPGHGHGHGHDHGDRWDRDDYAYVDAGPRGCPPGLAKKHNGCMPPGHAQRLVVGQPLPPGAYYTIPRHVRSTLPPPPAGYRYAVVNNQVVLVSNQNLVVDVIRSLLG